MSVQRLSIDLINDIAQLVRTGNYRRTAALLVGVSEDALHLWISRGRQVQLGKDHEHVCPRCGSRDDEPCITAHGNALKEFHVDRPRASQGEYDDLCLRLLETLTRADEEAKARSVVAWNRAIDQGDWRAAKEFLARRWPKEWGQEPIQMEHTITDRRALEEKILDILDTNDEA